MGLGVVFVFSVVLPAYLPVRAPGFSLSTNPTPFQVQPGSSGTRTVSINGHDGFSGLVKLSTSIPNGPNSLSVNVSPESVSLTPEGSAVATLSVTTTPVTPAGDYSITLLETSGTIFHTDTVSLSVVGFTISANPVSLIFSTGAGKGQSIITITSVNNFTGQINLVGSTSAIGPKASLSPNTFFLAKGETVHSTMTVEASAQGRFDATVTVIGDQFYQSVTFPVTVTSTVSGDFSITTLPTSLSVNPGTSQNVLVKLASLNGCSCLVTLSTSALGGFGVGISPFILTLVPGGTANSTLFLNASPTAIPGTYTLAVTGTSLSLFHSTQLSVTVTTQPVPDFSITANPPTFRVAAGSYGYTIISVRSFGGFAGTVSLSKSIIPSQSGLTSVTLNTTTLAIPASGVAFANLTITAAATGFLLGYNFTVTATSGATFHTVVGAFVVGSASIVSTASTGSPDREPLLSSVSPSGLLSSALQAGLAPVAMEALTALAWLLLIFSALSKKPSWAVMFLTRASSVLFWKRRQKLGVPVPIILGF